MRNRIGEDIITTRMTFDEYAVLRGFAGIEELMDHHKTNSEKEAIRLEIKKFYETVYEILEIRSKIK